ncbi:hypothetical protein GCM10017752_01300 [Streptomyces roseoviridis]
MDLVRVPRREAVAGPMGRFLVLGSRLVPGTVERTMSRQVDRTHLSRTEPAPAGHGNLYAPAPGAGATHGGWGGRRRTAMRRLTTATVLACVGVRIARRLRPRRQAGRLAVDGRWTADPPVGADEYSRLP